MNLFNRKAVAKTVERYLGKPVSLVKSRISLSWETINPATDLSVSEAQAVFDQARQGCYGRLHYIYSEIEQADPTLFICADRRASALSELDWKIQRSDVRRHRNADEQLAKDQIAFLETAFADCTNFYEGVEHLASAFFRGFAHIQPHYSKDGETLKSFDILDNWNFCFDRARQMWQWNPDASVKIPGEKSGMADIPAGELVSLIRRRCIDYPALPIALRNRLGEKDWGRFLERYGVPPCTIIMPQFTDKAEEEKYLQAAQDMADAGNGALPFGSMVSYATEARGTDPFTGFLDHQQKLIVLMATGGLLTSLAESGTGTLAGGAHEDSWNTIVRRDSRHIANAVNRQIAERLLSKKFPGQPMLAEFAFATEAPESAADIFETAGKAVAAGYQVVQADLETRTGFKLERPQAVVNGFAPLPPPVLNKQNAEKPVAKPLQKRLDAQRLSPEGGDPQNAPDAILRAFAKDMSTAGKAVADLLAITDPEKLKAAAAELAAKLPELLSADPEMAALVEQSLAESFAGAFKSGIVLNFDESQARAEDGKWTKDGFTSTVSSKIGAEIKSKIISDAQKLIDADDGWDYGIRMLPDDMDDVNVGEEIEASFDWADGENSGNKLEGVSTVGIGKNPEKAVQTFTKGPGGYPGRRVAIVRGISSGSGADEGEQLLSKPVIVSLYTVGDAKK